MTQKLTPEQTKALLDSLFALPDKVAKKKADKKQAPTPTPRAATPVQRSPAFKPALAIIEVVHQHCTTCNSEHQYIRSRRVRFESVRDTDLHTAVEIETVTIENLPRRIDTTYEDTNICPTCLMLSTMFEDYLAVAERPIQMELFHG
jgi:hypothetical protein